MAELDRWFGAASPVCRECGYDLAGLGVSARGDASMRCPECGAALEATAIAFVRKLPERWIWILCVWGPGLLSAALFTVLDRHSFDRPAGGLLLALCLGSIGLWLGAPAWYVGEFVSPPRRLRAVIWMEACGVVGNLVLCVLIVNAVREL
jgi:hypothetical protein